MIVLFYFFSFTLMIAMNFVYLGLGFALGTAFRLSVGIAIMIKDRYNPL